MPTDPLSTVVPAAGAAAASPTSAAGAAPNAAQLRTLASQFESLLLGEMLKEMRSSLDSDDDADADTGFGDNPLSQALDGQLGIALANAGGIGLGSALLPSLLEQAKGDPRATAPLPGSLVMPGAGAPIAASIAAAAAPVVAASPLSASTAASVAAPLGAAALNVPVGRVTSAYGWRRDPIDGEVKFHKGIDVAMPEGEPVTAAAAGQVSFAGEMNGYGLTVTVDHGNGLSTRYAHLSELDVQTGEAVGDGQVIAKSGSTGRSTGPHLHFEVLESGQAVEPE